MTPRRRTKILVTLGPATDPPGVLERLVTAGVDAVRVNTSHGTPDDWRRRVRSAREVAGRARRPLAVVWDLAGPKVRLAADVPVREVALGEEVGFARAPVAPDSGLVGVEWDDLADAAVPGVSEIVVGDGTPRLTVRGADPARGGVTALCTRPGVLGPRKGAALTNARAHLPAITAADLAALDLAAALEVDFVAMSFVRSPADVSALRDELADRGLPARLIAKIEKVEAVAAVDEIAHRADGLMVARGDLGVEAGVAAVPLMQKRIIRAAAAAGKLVVTATQMLESMIDAAEPTRAEAADIANAVMDGTSALMLSAETAIGRFPVAAVEAMAEIAAAAEAGEVAGLPIAEPQAETPEAVMQAAVRLAEALDVAALVMPTSTGGSVRAAVKFRPARPVVALPYRRRVADQLSLEWGVIPLLMNHQPDVPAMLAECMLRARAELGLRHGDTVVLTYGPMTDSPGTTNLIAVRRIGDEESRPA